MRVFMIQQQLIQANSVIRQQNTDFSAKSTSTGTDSTNPSFEDKTRLFNRPAEPLEMDENGRVKSYISFAEFSDKINAMGGEKVVFAEFLERRRNQFQC